MQGHLGVRGPHMAPFAFVDAMTYFASPSRTTATFVIRPD